ncbi:MAG: hypothetical protein IT319_16545 [Anaerolineae bacterium]|nr:hypothetical protein [Anaerolineae bacterium]
MIVNMYLTSDEGDPAEGSTNHLNWATYIAFAGTLLLGIAPFLVTTLSERVSFLANIVH